MKIFYRIGNLETNAGLWYDMAGNHTGLIHDRFAFCKSSDLAMPFDSEVQGYLSATETLDELKAWFTTEDMARLAEYGYRILAYRATDYKFHNGHWLIDQQTSVVVGSFLRVLQLHIKGQWRAMIDAGLKPDEYRDIKPFYISRFFEGKLNPALQDLFDLALQCSPATLEDITADFGLRIREYDIVELIEGYGRKAPRSLYGWKGLSVGFGREELGASENGKVFEVHLGKKIQ